MLMRTSILALKPRPAPLNPNVQSPEALNGPRFVASVFTGEPSGFFFRPGSDAIELLFLLMEPVLAIYPGSFDPVTNGHLDLIERGAKIFGRLVVAILRNTEKEPLFSLAERTEMLAEATASFPNVEIDCFHGLLVDYAKERKAHVILRGIRAVSDYEFELQMAMMNRKLKPGLETVFMLPAVEYSYLSSRLVREIAQLGGSVSGLVPVAVERRLRAKVI